MPLASLPVYQTMVPERVRAIELLGGTRTNERSREDAHEPLPAKTRRPAPPCKTQAVQIALVIEWASTHDVPPPQQLCRVGCRKAEGQHCTHTPGTHTRHISHELTLYNRAVHARHGALVHDQSLSPLRDEPATGRRPAHSWLGCDSGGGTRRGGRREAGTSGVPRPRAGHVATCRASPPPEGWSLETHARLSPATPGSGSTC